MNKDFKQNYFGDGYDFSEYIDTIKVFSPSFKRVFNRK